MLLWRAITLGIRVDSLSGCEIDDRRRPGKFVASSGGSGLFEKVIKEIQSEKRAGALWRPLEHVLTFCPRPVICRRRSLSRRVPTLRSAILKSLNLRPKPHRRPKVSLRSRRSNLLSFMSFLSEFVASHRPATVTAGEPSPRSTKAVYRPVCPAMRNSPTAGSRTACA